MRKPHVLSVVVLALALAGPARGEETHKDIGERATIWATAKTRFSLNFGPTGIVGWFFDQAFVVTAVDRGSPADGVVDVNERILAVNGRRFAEDEDPRRILGKGITESETEAKGGQLALTVWRGGKEQQVTVRLPVLGTYSTTWPKDCAKSRKILENACQWLTDAQLPSGAFMATSDDGFDVGPATDGLLLLASGDPRYLDTARRLAYWFVANPRGDLERGTIVTGGTWMWGWAYESLFLSEYYLLTGDTNVLPHLRKRRDVILAADHDCGSWCHGIKNTYYAVGGFINHIGITCLTSLALMRECGLEVPQEDIDKSAGYFRRYSIGGRHVHYGNHKCGPEWRPGGGGVGKDAIGTVVYGVLGDEATKRRFTQSVIDSYRFRDGAHAGPWLALIWGPIGASRATPAEFRMFVDYWQWFHDLGRRWDGSLMLPSNHGGAQYTLRGPVFTMGGQALIYALPLKKTRVTGATESPFAVRGFPRELRKARELADQKKWAVAATYLEGLLKGGRLSRAARHRGEMMLESIRNTLKSVDLALQGIDGDIRKRDLPRARNRVESLELLLGGAEGKLAAQKAQVNHPKYQAVFDAEEAYKKHRDACFTDRGSREIIEGLAASAEAGFVREKARRRLDEIKQWPSYRDSFSAESEWGLYYARWDKNRTDPYLLACTRKLAFGETGLWCIWVARDRLKAAGGLGDRPFSECLVPTSETAPQTWRYLALDKPEAPANWHQANFDDSKWKEGAAPFQSGKDKDWKTAHILMRKRFQVADPRFRALHLDCKGEGTADVFLNGAHLARVDGYTKKYVDLAVSPAGLPALRKGANVLAVKVIGAGRRAAIDAGLVGVKGAGD